MQNLVDFLYVYGDEYFEVSFAVDHFLHLTGVGTKLSAKDFYKNAKKANLTDNQFYFDARHPDAPILELIQDGVQDYFNDTKSTEFGINRKWHAIEAGLIL